MLWDAIHCFCEWQICGTSLLYSCTQSSIEQVDVEGIRRSYKVETTGNLVFLIASLTLLSLHMLSADSNRAIREDWRMSSTGAMNLLLTVSSPSLLLLEAYLTLLTLLLTLVLLEALVNSLSVFVMVEHVAVGRFLCWWQLLLVRNNNNEKKKKKSVASFQTLQIGRRIRIYVHPQLPFNPHRISFLALCTQFKKIRAFLSDSFFCRGFHDSLPDSFMFVRQCHGHCFILLLYIDDRILTRNDFSLLFLFVK